MSTRIGLGRAGGAGILARELVLRPAVALDRRRNHAPAAPCGRRIRLEDLAFGPTDGGRSPRRRRTDRRPSRGTTAKNDVASSRRRDRPAGPAGDRAQPRATQKKEARQTGLTWLRGQDLNLWPSGYEPDELPDCSTPRQVP